MPNPHLQGPLEQRIRYTTLPRCFDGAHHKALLVTFADSRHEAMPRWRRFWKVQVDSLGISKPVAKSALGSLGLSQAVVSPKRGLVSARTWIGFAMLKAKVLKGIQQKEIQRVLKRPGIANSQCEAWSRREKLSSKSKELLRSASQLHRSCTFTQSLRALATCFSQAQAIQSASSFTERSRFMNWPFFVKSLGVQPQRCLVSRQNEFHHVSPSLWRSTSHIRHIQSGASAELQPRHHTAVERASRHLPIELSSSLWEDGSKWAFETRVILMCSVYLSVHVMLKPILSSLAKVEVARSAADDCMVAISTNFVTERPVGDDVGPVLRWFLRWFRKSHEGIGHALWKQHGKTPTLSSAHSQCVRRSENQWWHATSNSCQRPDISDGSEHQLGLRVAFMDYTGARMTLICQSSSHLMVSHAAAPESPHIHHNCGSIWQAAIRHFVQRWDPSGGSGRCASMDQTWSNSYSAEVDFHQFSSTLML